MPLYNLILLNDDRHSFVFVTDLLRRLFGMTAERAFEIARQAHDTGRAVVWTGLRERVEFKADQIRTFHEPRDGGSDLGPVGILIEPA
jgi:ATP-dependent Clp protease adaptor protein ClpS